MADYSNSVVYNIVDETGEPVYVGSSRNFAIRVSKHKSKCHNPNDKDYNTPIYKYIRERGGFDSFNIVVVSHHNLQNKGELRIEEQREIDKHPYAMNKYKAYLTEEDRKAYQENYRKTHKEEIKANQENYRKTHAEEIKETNAKYRKTHAEEIKERMANYYATHKEEIKERDAKYYATHKEEIKEQMAKYNATHKEEIKERKSNYYATHKEKIKEKMTNYYATRKEEINEKLECPLCKKIVSKCNLRRHQNSKICMKHRITS